MHERNRIRNTRSAGLCALLCALSTAAAAQSVQPEETVEVPNQGTPNEGLPALRFPINDDDPVSSIPTAEQANKAPLDMGYWAMAVSDRAEAAVKKGEHAKAAKYFAALAAAVPDRAISFSKLCKSLELAGDHKHALEACRSALGKSGVTVDDHVRYVGLVLAGTAAIPKAQLADVDAIIDQLDSKLGANSVPLIANQLRCEVGLRLQDKLRLTACVQAFQKLAPKDPRTTAFGFALALQEHEFGDAEALIAQAKQDKLPAAAVAQMETALRVERERAPTVLGMLRRWLAPALAVACVVALFMLGTRRTRKLRLA
jgi:tetratricopeptide (TPR) repeat protein